MAFNLTAIMELGSIDRQMRSAQRRLKNASSLSAPQRERVAQAEKDLGVVQEENKQGEREVRRLEGDAEAKKAEITKAKVALNQTKGNEEYQALLRTIASREGELEEIETHILEAYEAADERAERRKKLEERLAQQQKELAAAQARVDAEEAKINEQIAGLESRRGDAAGKVSSEHLSLYERVLKHVGDSAVAEVVDEMCGGCHIKIRPDQISKVRGGKDLVTCIECTRILYGRWD